MDKNLQYFLLCSFALLAAAIWYNESVATGTDNGSIITVTSGDGSHSLDVAAYEDSNVLPDAGASSLNSDDDVVVERGGIAFCTVFFTRNGKEVKFPLEVPMDSLRSDVEAADLASGQYRLEVRYPGADNGIPPFQVECRFSVGGKSYSWLEPDPSNRIVSGVDNRDSTQRVDIVVWTDEGVVKDASLYSYNENGDMIYTRDGVAYLKFGYTVVVDGTEHKPVLPIEINFSQFDKGRSNYDGEWAYFEMKSIEEDGWDMIRFTLKMGGRKYQWYSLGLPQGVLPPSAPEFAPDPAMPRII